MKHISFFEQFLNESEQILIDGGSDIKISDSSNAKRLSSSDRKILNRVFRLSVVGHEDKISRAEFFDSGYKGITFNLNGKKMYLFYSPGRVGLEDQTMGHITLGWSLNSKVFSVGPDYYKSKFGQTGTEKKHEDEAIKLFKEFLDKQ